MYKVFIDNVPVVYEVAKEKDLLYTFKDHRFIEAAGGIVRRENKFLFIKRHGLWDIPKGKLDAGETPKIAAVREIEEECGLSSPQIIDHLMNTWHTYEEKGEKILKKTYWYLLEEVAETKELIPQEEEGITAVQFFKWEELDEVKHNTYLSIIEVIACLQEHLNQ
ncbi:MAG: NUDIX domain-containing protein [Crocinitomicaceae bacterium]